MEIIDRDATAQLEALRAGRVTATALMAATLQRIAERNPALNAIVALRPRDALMAEAAAADRATPAEPLHGLPVAVKDMVAVRGIASIQGSPIFAGHVPAADDPLAARLRAAGAILIGKTNVPEFGLGSHTANPVYGVTRNPYDPALSAGGSSGGAGAALAARMVALADGSDMMGSLRNPAGWNGVYSLRPSYGVVPGAPGGDAYIATLATEGPMARSPRDLSLLMSVLAAPEPRMPWGRAAGDLTSALGRDVRGMRIGWLADWGGACPMEDGILPACTQALEVFARLGATVDPVAPPFEAAALWQSWTDLRSLAVAGKLGALYEDPARRALLKPAAVWEIERGFALSGRAVLEASTIRSHWFARAAEMFESYDALALPSAQLWPFPAEWDWPRRIGAHSMDTYHRWMEVVVPVSLLGLPAVTVPAGPGARGLPIGVQIFGTMGADAAMLALAGAYHTATHWPDRHAPV